MITITYYAPTSSMGDTSESDADQFRSWAESQLIKRFPDFDINFSHSEGALSHYRICGEVSWQQEEEIADFTARLWDKCPWNFQ